MFLVLALGVVLFLGQPSALGTTSVVEQAIILLFAWIVGLSAAGGYPGASLHADSGSSSGRAVSP